ncbi:hypothetical protein RvY_14340-1 [Ramazzottius varieornatus]|uniref:Transporter n=1 Tax=Ramazzottius varieornatus TaxID=947166 RepID=A0A1D1VSP6_RAMVA|nr:hypothetical protein RvY_14340-1 [Ramazzottius varieornatus]
MVYLTKTAIGSPVEANGPRDLTQPIRGEDDESENAVTLMVPQINYASGSLLTVPVTVDPARRVSRITLEDRVTWDKKIDFLLSVIGFSVDLSNVWRFPYLCYKNGGGAFLVPYMIFFILGGVPLFYLELALGQYNRKGAVTCWGRLVPLFKGVGLAVVLVSFFVDLFYNQILSWALYFFFASFAQILPWATCGNEWNTDSCVGAYDEITDTQELSQILHCKSSPSSSQNYVISNVTIETVQQISTCLRNAVGFSNATNVTVTIADVASACATLDQNVTTAHCKSSAEEYFYRSVLQLHKSPGLEDLGEILWPNTLCLLAIYIICYFSLWKGVLSSGKVGK